MSDQKPPENNPAKGLEWYRQDEGGSMHYVKAEDGGPTSQIVQRDHACMRCGGEHTLTYLPIRNPQDQFSFFAMCPTLNQPIWLAFAPEGWEPCATCHGVGVVRKVDVSE